jgi:hypothetical protein
MVQQVEKRDGASTEGEEERTNEGEWLGESPMAKKKIGSNSADQIMKYKDGFNSSEKWDEGKEKVWGIKGPRLKVCQKRKSQTHVAIPERKLAGHKTLSQAESHGVKKRAEIAEEGDFVGENHFIGKYQDREGNERKGEECR